MGRRPYSEDVRSLVVGEVEAGASRRAAARRFKVSASSAIRWVDRHDETGSVSCEPRRARSRSPWSHIRLGCWNSRRRGSQTLALAEIEELALEGPRGRRTARSTVSSGATRSASKKRCTQPKIGPTSPRPGRASRPARRPCSKCRGCSSNLAEVGQIDRHAAIWARHEMFGLTLDRLADALSKVLPARGFDQAMGAGRFKG